MKKSEPVLPVKVMMHAMHDGKLVQVELTETEPNHLKGICKDSCVRAQLTFENRKPAISFTECKQSWLKKHRDWDPRQFELREGAVMITPSWMDEHPFWQLGANPLNAALHGGTSMRVGKTNRNTHTSSLFACGRFTVSVTNIKLVDLPVDEFLIINPDGRSFRLRNPEGDTRQVIVLYHQDPKKSNGRKLNDPAKVTYWNPGDENPESPNYWQPLYSDGAAALVIPLAASKHGMVLNVGSRDNERIDFNKDDAKFRLLECTPEALGTITIDLSSH